jgi:hypothetical protein
MAVTYQHMLGHYIGSYSYSFSRAAAHTMFPSTESPCTFGYQRLVVQGLTMVATFLIPLLRSPNKSGGIPLPTIQKGQVYVDNFTNCSGLQGVALAGKISHNACHMTIGQKDKISKNRLKTTIPQHQTTNVSQDMHSVVSYMQRMVSDQAELLKKIFYNQEKQA